VLSAHSSNYRAQQRLALLLVMLMVTLPWSAMTSSDLDGGTDDSRATPKVWGAGGSNDTGWISLEATGADPASGTLAYADLFLDFAPGALLDNFTFEIAVDGSEGYWASEPQITLLDTQTPILDWRDYGDLGRQNSFSNNPPEVEGGLLDTWLQPNSVSDASWLLPSGVTIEDLVIEALRPADPRVSFSSLNVVIHDSAVNPHDGRLYVLLDDECTRGSSTSITISRVEASLSTWMRTDFSSGLRMARSCHGACLTLPSSRI